MGFSSWMFADTDNVVALKIGKTGYLSCPDGTVVTEMYYNGYTSFSSYDVYELIADWNKEYISSDSVKKPSRAIWNDGPEGDKWYKLAIRRYNNMVKSILDFKADKPKEIMVEEYGTDWKREIGIQVACFDEDNKNLKYPIKICQVKDNAYHYESLPASKHDPEQGCY